MTKIENTFKMWLQKWEVPKHLMRGKMILISKDKTNSPNIESTRPITLLLTIIKLFENSIVHNLKEIIISDKFNKNQRGFIKGKSTLDNIRDVLNLARILKQIKPIKTPRHWSSLTSQRLMTLSQEINSYKNYWK